MQGKSMFGMEEMSCCGPVESDKPMAHLLEIAEAGALTLTMALRKGGNAKWDWAG